MHESKNAVVVPILASDLATVRLVLNYWANVNPPFLDGTSVSDLDLVYVLPCEKNESVEVALREAIDASGVALMFADVRIHFSSIPESFDYYIRDPRGLPPTEEGFIAGPNRVFFDIAKSIGSRYEWCFLMELDCLPLLPGWGEAVRREMTRYADAWVVGSRYHGWSWLGPELEQHLNGNAFYRFGDESFQEFLDEVWAPGMKELISCGYPGLAFDCFPSILSALAIGPLVSRDVREMAAKGYGRFVESSVLLNLSGSEDTRSKFESVDSLIRSNPDTYLFHATWLMEELDLLPTGSEKPKVSDEEQRASTLSHCVKSVFVARNAWFFADRFAFRANGSAIVMQIAFDKEKVSSMAVRGDSGQDLRFTAKRYSDKRVGGTGIIKLIASALSIFGLRKRHGISLKRSLASWCLRFSSASRTDVIGAIRIWMRELRGRKVASGRGGIDISMKSLGKADGITLVIRSESDELVEGRLQIDVQ